MKKRTISPKHSGDEIRQEYFQWLCGLVGVSTPDHSYWSLAVQLHNTEFYWTVPNDDDRAAHGQKLRETFLNEIGNRVYAHCLEGPCSLFEMLIALAFRLDYIMSDPSRNSRAPDYFWEFIRNLGLEPYTDDEFINLLGPYSSLKIIEKFLERSYNWKGEGGLFPLKYSDKDQRKVEIWYQLMAYVSENNVF